MRGDGPPSSKQCKPSNHRGAPSSGNKLLQNQAEVVPVGVTTKPITNGSVVWGFDSDSRRHSDFSHPKTIGCDCAVSLLTTPTSILTDSNICLVHLPLLAPTDSDRSRGIDKNGPYFQSDTACISKRRGDTNI